MRRNMIMLAAGLAAIAWNVQAQSVRSLISDGNSAYREQRYADAEARYREALQEEQGLLPGHFNLGNALERQGKYDEALRQFEVAEATALETTTKAHARYNRGNTLFDAGQYREAADAFIESLKIDPDDQDAKFNLSLALKKLQEQQQQQDKNKDKNKDQDKNQQKKDQQQDQDKNDQQKKDQQQDKDKPQKQEPQDQERQQASSPREKSMSKADAERILEVLRNSEKDIQKKLRARQATRPKTDKDW